MIHHAFTADVCKAATKMPMLRGLDSAPDANLDKVFSFIAELNKTYNNATDSSENYISLKILYDFKHNFKELAEN